MKKNESDRKILISMELKLFVLTWGLLPCILSILFTIIIGKHIVKLMGTFLGVYFIIFIILFWIILILANNSRLLTIVVSMGLSFIVIMLLFMSIEVFYNLKYKDISVGSFESPSGVTFYPKYYKLNKIGFRDREFSLEAPKNTVRILVLGDSFTFGNGVKDFNMTYPKKLEEILNNNSSVDFEVINAGVGGSNTEDQLILLKTKGIAFNPDIVMLGYYINDTDKEEDNKPIFHKENKIFKAIDKVMCAHFFSWYLLRMKIHHTITPFTYMPRITSKDHLLYHEKIFKEMVDYLKKRNIEFIVAIFPPVSYDEDKMDKTQWDVLIGKSLSHMRSLCIKYNVKYVDMYKVTDKMRDKYGALNVSPFDSHPNEILHQAFAEELADNLKIHKK